MRALRRRPAAMFLTPPRRMAPMARLRQVAIARGALPVRNWEASSAKVVSRTWRRASIFQWSRTSCASRAGGGLLGGRAGHRVDGGDGGLAGLAVGVAALDLDGLAGSGKEQVVHGGDLDSVDLRAAMVAAARAALERDALPGRGLQLLAQFLLIALDDRNVVGSAAQQVAGVLALGMQCVAGDDRPNWVGDGVQQRLGAGGLAGFLADVELGQDQAGVVLHRRKKVDLPSPRPGRAAQGLAVHGQSAQPGAGGAPSSQPAPAAWAAPDQGAHRAVPAPGAARPRSTRRPPAAKSPPPAPRTRPGPGQRRTRAAHREGPVGPAPRPAVPAGPPPPRARRRDVRGAGQGQAESAMMRRQAQPSRQVTGRRELHDLGNPCLPCLRDAHQSTNRHKPDQG